MPQAEQLAVMKARLQRVFHESGLITSKNAALYLRCLLDFVSSSNLRLLFENCCNYSSSENVVSSPISNSSDMLQEFLEKAQALLIAQGLKFSQGHAFIDWPPHYTIDGVEMKVDPGLLHAASGLDSSAASSSSSLPSLFPPIVVALCFTFETELADLENNSPVWLIEAALKASGLLQDTSELTVSLSEKTWTKLYPNGNRVIHIFLLGGTPYCLADKVSLAFLYVFHCRKTPPQLSNFFVPISIFHINI